MGCFQHKKQLDNKRYTVEVEVFFIENLTIFYSYEPSCKYSYVNCYNYTVTLILQDDHLASGAWATCGVRESMSSAPGSRLG